MSTNSIPSFSVNEHAVSAIVDAENFNPHEGAFERLLAAKADLESGRAPETIALMRETQIALNGPKKAALVKHQPVAIERVASGEPVVEVSDSWPEPMSEVAFHGLAGDFVRMVMPETEGDRQAILLAFLLGVGCMAGRHAYYQVEATQHHVNLDCVIVGDTAKARKGTATDRAMDILARVDADFVAARKRSGLSSGEGLIEAVRDQREEDVVDKKSGDVERRIVDSGEPDKRLLVVESEFANVLQQSGRDGNILSAVLRDAWDGKPLRVLARSNKDSCQEPHISMLGNITIEELQRLLTSNDKANGFGNRILWCCARRSKKLPHGGGPLDENRLAALVEGLQSALAACRTIGRVQFDADAYSIWEPAYDELTEGGDGMFGSMTARAEAQVVRLSTLYALLDRSNLIRVEHLNAAMEVWSYCEESVRHIFGTALGDETADAILKLLSNSPDGLSQTDINRAFSGNKKSADLNRALALLQKRQRVASEKNRETGGGPAIRWRLCTK